MGTPEFAKIILEHLFHSGFPILAVFSQPDKPVGRGQKMAKPPVAEFAVQNNLKLYQPATLKDPQILDLLNSLQPDFLIVAAYGKILSQNILDVPKIDSLNVHASLLPLYRGAAPIQCAILDNQATTGVSIMSMALELDAGPVYSMQSVTIDESDTDLTLTHKLAHQGAQTLVEALSQISAGLLKATPQNHAEATYAHKLTKDRGRVNWNQSARVIFNQVRALSSWPVAETTIHGKRLRIFETRVLNSKTQLEPGTIVHIAPQGLTVATQDGDLLLITCQAEGKKRMPAYDVSLGLRLNCGDLFL